jgi:hypothetical protein
MGGASPSLGRHLRCERQEEGIVYDMGTFLFSLLRFEYISYERGLWGDADNYLELRFHCLVRLLLAILRDTGGQPSETSDDRPFAAS